MTLPASFDVEFQASVTLPLSLWAHARISVKPDFTSIETIGLNSQRTNQCIELICDLNRWVGCKSEQKGRLANYEVEPVLEHIVRIFWPLRYWH